MKNAYAVLLEDESGYKIIAQHEDGSESVELVQPEPYIIYRVLGEDGLTDYQASGDLHAKHFLEDYKQAITEAQQEQTLKEKVELLQTQQTESEIDIDFRLSLLELGLA